MAKDKDAELRSEESFEAPAGEQLTRSQRERIKKSIELMSKTMPMKIDELLPYQRNQKDHPEEQIKALANSLRRFGWRQPVVIDEHNVIVIGHGRVLGAKMLGLSVAPVISAEDLTEDEIRELRIIDNKTNESKWNDFLAEDVAELSFDGFDMEFLGFDTISDDGFSDSFSLPEGEKKPFQQISITVHDRQAELMLAAIQYVYDQGLVTETFSNENHNGNGLYEVVREWAEQKKLS